MVLQGEIILMGVRSEDQVADIFTKALAKAKFEKFRNALGLINNKHAPRGSITN